MPRRLLLAATLLPASAAAQAGTDFSFRRELAAGARVHVANVIGDVRVEAAAGRAFEVSAVKREGRHGDPDDVEIRALELGDGVAICVIYPAQRRAWEEDRPPRRRRDGGEENPCSRNTGWSGDHERNDTEIDFTVKVPAGLKVRIGTVSGDVVAAGLSGELQLRSVSGDVRLDGGDGSRISLETVSGDVELLRIRSPEVEGHTVSGRITFEGPVQDRGTYDFLTTSGSITLTLPEQPNATVSAATFSGRFSSTWPTTASDGRRRRSRHNAVWGNGSARVDVESLSGNISIRSSR